MSVLINVPTPLRSITKDRTVEVDGSTLAECINNLEETLKCFDSKLKNFIDYLIPIYGEDTLIVVISDHLMMSGMRFYKDYFDNSERYMTNIFITDELIKVSADVAKEAV